MKNPECKVYQYSDLVDKDYIELRLGKKRKKGFKESSIFFRTYVFSLFHEIIWDKYREFQPGSTNVMSKREWLRVFEDIEEYKTAIKSSKNELELKKAMIIRGDADFCYDNEFNLYRDNILLVLTTLHDWVVSSLEEEDNVTICV